MKQFRILINTIVPENALTKIRKAGKNFAKELLDSGAWVTDSAVRVSDSDGDVQVIIDISGPRLDPSLVEYVKATCGTIAESAVTAGGKVLTLEVHADGLSDNLLTPQPEPFSVQAQITELTGERDQAISDNAALAARASVADELNEALELLRSELLKVANERDTLRAKYEPSPPAIPNQLSLKA